MVIESQFDADFVRNFGHVPFEPQEDEELSKFRHMQSFGRHNRRIGDEGKLEIEKQADRLQQMVSAREEQIKQNKLSLKSLISYFRDK